MPPPSRLNFFDHNPPPEQLVDVLFCNRERELRQGLAMLDDAASCNEILAVYGPTRSGKSHYVRRLLNAVKARSPAWRVLAVNANNRGSVRSVLEDVFIELWKAVQDLEGDIPEEEQANYRAYRRDLEVTRALVLGEFAESSTENQQGGTQSTDGGVELKLGPASVHGGGKLEIREQFTEKNTRRIPTDREVTGYIRDTLDALRQYDPVGRTMVFIDDLDLLDRRGREGAEVSAQLVDQLKSIAECRQCLVMVTIRELYFNGREKDFNDFVALGFLGEAELREVYGTHIKVFNEGRAVFAPDVVDLIVKGADGRVGIFLKTCREIWRYHIDAAVPIGRPELAEYLRSQLRRFKDDAVKHLIPEIERVLAGEAFQVVIQDDLQETPLLYSVLLPIPGQPGKYTVNPMWLDVLGPTPLRGP